MKATDLMIGDWVFINNLPIKVTDIDESEGINREWIGGAVCEDAGCISWEYIKPIPLTPEILEKNGFKSNYNEEFTIDDKYSIYMSILNPQYTATPRVMTGDIEDGDGGIYFNLSYVHELQHLLRLCKIEKEIVL